MPSKAKVSQALQKAAHRNAELIGGSKWFLCLYNEKMVQEVIPLLQMGLAIYLDKPVVLLVPKGAIVPMNLRRLALDIAEFDPGDPDSMAGAMQQLSRVLQQ